MTKRPIGRPPKHNQELIEQLLNLIREGVPIKRACQRIGIAQSTYYEWRAKPEYSEIFSIAEASPETHILAKLYSMAIQGHFQAASWLLERRFGYVATSKLELSQGADHAELAVQAKAELAARLEQIAANQKTIGSGDD